MKDAFIALWVFSNKPVNERETYEIKPPKSLLIMTRDPNRQL